MPYGTKTIFSEPRGGKAGTRYQGLTTKAGTKAFEAAREQLQRAAKWPRPPSDGDVFEYLARGKKLT